jgi:transposase
MDQWVKRTQRDYTLSFKLAVVDQVERGELTIAQAQARYGIQGSSTVQTWLRKHGHHVWKAASSRAKGRNMAEPKPKPQTPEQRIKELEVQLKEAKEKAAFFEAMVTVIQRDQGIEVTKKPLGKFSRKSSSKD